jgi:hypothetical protein
MSIPIGTKMLTKPPKQKSKIHLKNHTFKKKLAQNTRVDSFLVNKFVYLSVLSHSIITNHSKRYKFNLKIAIFETLTH